MAGGCRGLDREFGWSEDTAERYMALHRLNGQIPQVAEFQIPISGLYLLAAPSTSEEARIEAIERAENGERFTHEGKADDEARASAETAEVSERRLREARQVGRYSVELFGIRSLSSDRISPL
jgi:hypothetical protein